VCLFTLSAGIGGLGLGIAVAWMLRQKLRGEVSLVREAAVGLAGIAGAVGFALATVFLLVPRGAGDVRFGPFDLIVQESGRVSAWKGALQTIVDHPLRGVGLGSTVALVTNPRAAHVMEHWGTAHMETPVALHMEAHNIWLNVAGQLGLPGLVAFVALMVLLCRSLLPAKGDRSDLAEVRLVLFGTFVGAVLYHGLAAAIEESRQYWYLFGLIVAAKLLVQDSATTPREQPPPCEDRKPDLPSAAAVRA
jgi:O-antigen ligase